MPYEWVALGLFAILVSSMFYLMVRMDHARDSLNKRIDTLNKNMALRLDHLDERIDRTH